MRQPAGRRVALVDSERQTRKATQLLYPARRSFRIAAA